jgi:hypothetical protein
MYESRPHGFEGVQQRLEPTRLVEMAQSLAQTAFIPSIQEGSRCYQLQLPVKYALIHACIVLEGSDRLQRRLLGNHSPIIIKAKSSKAIHFRLQGLDLSKKLSNLIQDLGFLVHREVSQVQTQLLTFHELFGNPSRAC